MPYLAHYNISNPIKTLVKRNVESLLLSPLSSWAQWAWAEVVKNHEMHSVDHSGLTEWELSEEGAVG